MARARRATAAPIDSYRVTPFLAGATQPQIFFKSTKTTQVISGLKHGRHYQFKVEAHNKIGWSDFSPVSATILVK